MRDTPNHRLSNRWSAKPAAQALRPCAGLLLALLLGFMSGGAGQAQPVEPNGGETPTVQMPIAPTMPVYKPRARGPSRGRVDGGFRGGQGGEPVLKVLAPADHVGETVKKRPALFWFLSSPTSYPIVFTLEDTTRYQPIVERTLPAPTKAGIQMIRLSDFEHMLEERVQYRWHISIVVDPESRSKDIHAMGVIERRPCPIPADLAHHDYECMIATSDFGYSPALRDWNRFCVQGGRRFFPVLLQNMVGHVGPLVVPHETACFECFLARRDSHLEKPELHRAVDAESFEGQRVSGFHPTMTSIVAELAAFELIKSHTRGLPFLVGTYIEVSLLAPRMIPRKVLKIPRCLVCSPLHTHPSVTLKKEMFTLVNREDA